MRRFWQSDTALKIFSIICAIALWCYVIAAQNPEIEVKVKNIPIQIDAASEETLYRATGLSVLKPSGGMKTALTVKGRRSVIGGVDNKNIKAVVDVSGIEKEGVSDPLTIDIRLPESTGLYVMNISPLQVSYTVEPRKYRVIPVQVISTGSLSSGLVTESLMPSPSEIEVWGPRSVIEEIDRLVVSVDLSGKTDDFSEECSFVAMDAEGRTVDAVNIASKTEKVKVQGIIHHEKAVELTADTASAALSSEFVISSVSVDPKRITVYGEEAAIADLEKITVLPDFKTLQQQTGQQKFKAELQLPDGIVCDSLPDEILVTVTVKENKTGE